MLKAPIDSILVSMSPKEIKRMQFRVFIFHGGNQQKARPLCKGPEKIDARLTVYIFVTQAIPAWGKKGRTCPSLFTKEIIPCEQPVNLITLCYIIFSRTPFSDSCFYIMP